MNQGFNVEKISELARLRLSPEEAQKISTDLAKILNYVEQLQKVDTSKVEPTSHVLPLENVFRDDSTHPSEVRDAVLKHAPKREANFFKVPKIIDQ